MGVVTAHFYGGPRDGHQDRIAQVPELVAVVWHVPWQRYIVYGIEPDNGRRDLDRYLLAARPEPTGAGIAIYHWLNPDPNVHDALRLPVGEPQTFAGLRTFPGSSARARAWDARMRRLRDAL